MYILGASSSNFCGFRNFRVEHTFAGLLANLCDLESSEQKYENTSQNYHKIVNIFSKKKYALVGSRKCEEYSFFAWWEINDG